MIILQGEYAKAYVMIDNVEPECISQIYTFLNHPIYENCKLIIMPDTHGGSGSVIGFTMEMIPFICPNIVGVDIGCGMLSAKMCYPLSKSLSDVDKNIRKVVPLGFDIHSKSVVTMENRYPFKQATIQTNNFIKRFNEKFGTDYTDVTLDYEYYKNLCAKLTDTKYKTPQQIMDYIDRSIGTLGGGNHFIEIGKDDTGENYITIHTGSRNFGNRVAVYYQKQAQSMDYNKSGPRDLAYLANEDAMEYFIAMNFVQKFAQMNREIILSLICNVNDIKIEEGYVTESVHNFIDFHDMIIRKGAIRSYVGEKMVIPFNMRDGMLLCEGKSNSEWNFSAPHGAGRLMSRSQAKKNIDLETFKKQMEGIYSTSVGIGTLDESPDTYKPMQIIKDAITPTAAILETIKPLLNIKG
jgi:tRNA-splicing ligase RtcB